MVHDYLQVYAPLIHSPHHKDDKVHMTDVNAKIFGTLNNQIMILYKHKTIGRECINLMVSQIHCAVRLVAGR